MIDQQAYQSEYSTDEEAKYLVIHVVGDEAPTFVLKCQIKNEQFSTIINAESPITTTIAENRYS